jgi:hypothetical protein
VSPIFDRNPETKTRETIVPKVKNFSGIRNIGNPVFKLMEKYRAKKESINTANRFKYNMVIDNSYLYIR